MLTTRCPDCRTTFRISSTALHQAAGQVRCGRCDAVFDAFESLTDTRQPAKVDPRESRPDEPPAAAESEPPAEIDEAAESEPPAEIPDAPEFEQLAEIPAPEGSATERLEKLKPAKPAAVETWHPAQRIQMESRGWRLAAALACVVLALQVVHHFRVSLTETPYVGAWLARAYALARMPIPENADPADFAIVDWVAAAQDSENSRPGRLEISTSVRNDSNKALAYPLLSLQLTDRWEKVIGARVFKPDEYLGASPPRDAKIAPGATLSAQLELVDPGPDAYGFEIDVCVTVDSQSMRCKSDAVFE
jgi:predicted Zn finger-like uncharacterized protein